MSRSLAKPLSALGAARNPSSKPFLLMVPALASVAAYWMAPMFPAQWGDSNVMRERSLAEVAALARVALEAGGGSEAARPIALSWLLVLASVAVCILAVWGWMRPAIWIGPLTFVVAGAAFALSNSIVTVVNTYVSMFKVDAPWGLTVISWMFIVICLATPYCLWPPSRPRS